MTKQLSVDVVVDGTPDQVAARLRARTRERAFPAHRPADGAEGTLEQVGDGRTRVRALCALPTYVVWYLRIAWLALPALLLGSSALVGSGDTTLLPLAAFAVLAIVIATLGIGVNVSYAEADLAPIDEALREALGAGVLSRVPSREAERDQSRV